MKYVVSDLNTIKTRDFFTMITFLDKALCFLLYLFSDPLDLSLSYDHNTTSDISPLLFDQLLWHLNKDQIRPFYQTYSGYLFFAKPPSCGLSHEVLWETNTAKEIIDFLFLFLFLCLWKDGAEGVDGEAEVKRTGCALKLFIRRLFLYNPLPPCNLSLFLYMHRHTLGLCPQTKSRPCGPVIHSCLSCSQKDPAQISWFEIWKVL